CAEAAAMRAATGQFAAEHAGRQAPVPATETGADAEPAADCEGIGRQRLGDEVVVPGRGQLLEAVGLLELPDLQVGPGRAIELVLRVGIQELAVARRVIAERPLELARALALQCDLG